MYCLPFTIKDNFKVVVEDKAIDNHAVNRNYGITMTFITVSEEEYRNIIVEYSKRKGVSCLLIWRRMHATEELSFRYTTE